jgi:hypothetical protein
MRIVRTGANLKNLAALILLESLVSPKKKSKFSMSNYLRSKKPQILGSESEDSGML